MKQNILLLFFSITLVCFSQNKKEPDYLELLDNALYLEFTNMKMEVGKNEKVMKYYEMEFFRSGDKMRMEFTGPAIEKGRKMLNDNSSLWMYLPRTSKTIKLPFKQAFMGSDASNTDLMRMVFKKDYEITYVDIQDNMAELELKAKDLEVAYNKVKIWLDMNKKVPVKQEMYSLSGKIIKTISYENIIKVGNDYIPSLMIIKDELQKNSFTRLYYNNIKKRNDKPSEFFTLGSLKR